MPTAIVELEDGKKLKLDVEKGTTEKEISEAVDNFLKNQSPTLAPTASTASTAPGFGQIVGGMGTEIGIGAAGKYGGLAFGGPIGYGVGAISSGIVGSVAAQKLEGRDTISWGRAISAGLINLIPGTELSKAAIKSGKVIKEAAKVGAKEGFYTGAGEAQITSIIDEGKLASFEDTLTYGTVGAGLGLGLGAGTKAIIKKSRGKSPSQIDEEVAHNTITKEDVVEASTAGLPGGAQARPEVSKQVERSRNHYISGNTANTIINNTNPSTGWMTKIYKSLPLNVRLKLADTIPSLAVGRRIADTTTLFNNMIKSAESVGARVDAAITRKIKGDPDVESKINEYLDGGQLDDSLKDIENNLIEYRTVLNEQQEILLQLLDDDMISSLTKEERKELAEKIRGSMKNGNYVTREYRLFVDRNFDVDDKKKALAIKEMTFAIEQRRIAGRTYKNTSKEEAEEIIEDYISKSAKQKSTEPKGASKQPIDKTIRARSLDPVANAALMDMMGVITEPGERARGTITSISKLVARHQTENEIEQILLSTGLAKESRDSIFNSELTGRQGKRKIFVEPETQLAYNQLYASSAAEQFSDSGSEIFGKMWSTAVGTSKATKVLFNAPSYFVQVYGNAATLIQLGFNPLLPASQNSGFRVATADINLFGKPRKVTKQLLQDIREAEKYGIKGTNVVESDMRATFEKGFEPVEKIINPAATLYAVPDTYFRYIGWLKTQEALKKMYKSADPENIKKASALLINDTYQNYAKLNIPLRKATRVGLLPQFASFTSEFARNQYYMGKQAKQLFQGTYAQDLGIDLGPVDTQAMKKEFSKRMLGTAFVFGGIAAAQKGFEAGYGVSEKMKSAFIESGMPEYDKNSPTILTTNEGNKTYGYMNTSYIAPQAIIFQAFKQGFDGSDETTLAKTLAQEFVGEGSFAIRSVISGISNVDIDTGNPISYKEDELARLKESLSISIFEGILQPGQAREVEKFIRARRGKGPYTVSDVAQRQVGLRINKGNVDDAFRYVARDTYTRATASKSEYRSLLRYGPDRGRSQEEIAREYTKLNSDYQESMEALIKHNQNYIVWDKSEDERIEILKNSGISNKDVLYILTGKVPTLALDLTASTREIIDEFGFDFTDTSPKNVKLIRDKIQEAYPDDPKKVKNLINYAKRNFKKSKFTGKERLINGLLNRDKIDYLNSLGINNNKAYLKELRAKNVINEEVYNALK